GDVHDPESEVSRAIRERGGYALMPELGTRPANHYLPRQLPQGAAPANAEAASPHQTTARPQAAAVRPAPSEAALEVEARGLFAKLFGAFSKPSQTHAGHKTAEVTQLEAR
ncbi:MAG: ferredoxin, partial [Thiomonas sp. 14-64-326]